MMANEVKAGPQPGWSAADNHDHPAEQKPATVEETPLPVAGTPNATVATQNNEVETTTAKSETPNTDGDAQNAEEAIAVEAELSISEGETQITTTEETTDSETESTETTESETLSTETTESETLSTETTESETSSSETAESETFFSDSTESETSSAETANNNNNEADFSLKLEQQDQTEMKKTNLLTAFVSLLFGSTNAADKYNVSSGNEVEQSELTQGNWKIEGSIYANLSMKPVIDKPPPTTEKITTENNTTACKCDNGNVGRMRSRHPDYWNSKKREQPLDEQDVRRWEKKELNFNGIDCIMDASDLQYLRTKIRNGSIVKYKLKGVLNGQTEYVLRKTLKRIEKFSCLKFEKASPEDIEKHVLPSQQDAELFLKIMEFSLYEKKREKIFKRLSKRFFKKKISEKKWKKFLENNAREFDQKWSEFKPSKNFWGQHINRTKKLSETWQKYMKKLSPVRILTIHIKGECSENVTRTAGSYTYFNGHLTMSARVKDDENITERWLGETVWDRTLTHEIFHAVGIQHTETLTERDSRIIFNWTSIPDAYIPQLEICKTCNLHKNISYECDSIMHIGQQRPNQPNIHFPKFQAPWLARRADCFRENLTPREWPTTNDWNHFKAAIECNKKEGNKKSKKKKKKNGNKNRKKNGKKKRTKNGKKKRTKNRNKNRKKNGKEKSSKRRNIGNNMQRSVITPNTDNNCRCDSQENGADYAAIGEYGADYSVTGEYDDFNNNDENECIIV